MIKLINDHFQNYKPYQLPKAQLIIADIPYNIGKNAYGSNPAWYINGDNANGESELAGKEFFTYQQRKHDIETFGFAKTEINKSYPTLFQ